MPNLEVGASGSGALSTLVDGYQLIVVHFEERNNTLALAIGSLDVATGSTNCGPRTSKATSPL